MDFIERHAGICVTIAIVVILAGLGYISLAVNRYQCGMLGLETNRSTKYVGAACYVQLHDGQWVREDELAVRGKN